MEDILLPNGTTLIVNGGNPLGDCPLTYDEADVREVDLNKDTIEGIKWSFDCGFKLDFDGSLLSVSSRFYPPKTHYGEKWDGHCSISFCGGEVASKKFETDTLPELKSQVESFVREFMAKLLDGIEEL